MTQSNPLLRPSALPFELPQFGAISPADFPSAFEAAFEAHDAEIAAIAGQSEPATFTNTLVALERAGGILTSVSAVFFNLTGADTNPVLQEIERDIAPKLAAHRSRIMSNAALFSRIDRIWRQRDSLGLEPEQFRLVERVHLDFVRAGAGLDTAGKQRLAAIDERLARLSTQFGQNVQQEETSYSLDISAPEDRRGLPDFLVAAAAASAEARGGPQTHVITLSRSLIEPFLVFSEQRHLREAAWRAWTSRGANGDATDNRGLISEMLALRHERAVLLGFSDHVAFKLANSMAGHPDRVRDLLDRVWPAACAKAADERTDLEAIARAEGANDPVAAWDWRHYAEKARRAAFDLDEAEIKPYLSLDAMIAAAFHTAERLFGLTFEPRDDLELYHSDARAWDVRDRAGSHMGLFIGDYFARSSKRSGAWMSAFRRQRNLDGRVRPIIVNVCNFAKAPKGEPTLLSFDDARTLFHEFGHALHGLMSNVTYPSLAGTSVATDFVELPSQLYEHWLGTDPILSRFATHYRTGEPMPATLRNRLAAARNYGQGFATVEYVASALVDLALHADAAAVTADPAAYERQILQRLAMPAAIAPRHAATHFLHLFAGGYSAGYYSYMWSEVLDADAFKAFEETGDVFDAGVAGRLRDYVYAAGGSRPETEAYLAFRGRMPSVEGLLEKRGLM